MHCNALQWAIPHVCPGLDPKRWPGPEILSCTVLYAIQVSPGLGPQEVARARKIGLVKQQLEGHALTQVLQLLGCTQLGRET